MATVTYREAHRCYPDTPRAAVDNLSLEIGDGEFMVLVGPSGCGKTTSLRMLAGLEPVTSGSICIGDRDVTHLAPRDRDIAMVFQNYALYPHMTVADNLGFALRLAKQSKVERLRRVREAAQMLGLTDLLERKPRNLSGGQRQRVAMGRAIVRQPQVFCMDEPLSNLDAKLRVSTRTQIAELQQRLGVTTVYVTHDQVEAMTMGDRVAVMNEGVLQQVDDPLSVYDRPANLFVASFIGSPAINLLEVSVVGSRAMFGDYGLDIARDVADAVGGTAIVGIRPEAWRPAGTDEPCVELEVTLVEELGAEAYVYGNCRHGDVVEPLVLRLDSGRQVSKGARIRIATDAHRIHIFDPETGTRLAS
ncbi:MAG: ABC transporter ATP-binding protein [Vicinamibacterales bacterium]